MTNLSNSASLAGSSGRVLCHGLFWYVCEPPSVFEASDIDVTGDMRALGLFRRASDGDVDVGIRATTTFDKPSAERTGHRWASTVDNNATTQ